MCENTGNNAGPKALVGRSSPPPPAEASIWLCIRMPLRAAFNLALFQRIFRTYSDNQPSQLITSVLFPASCPAEGTFFRRK